MTDYNTATSSRSWRGMSGKYLLTNKYMWARSFFPRADCNFLAPRKEYYRHAKCVGKELPFVCKTLKK